MFLLFSSTEKLFRYSGCRVTTALRVMCIIKELESNITTSENTDINPILVALLVSQSVPGLNSAVIIIQNIVSFVTEFGQNYLNQAVEILGTTDGNFSTTLENFLSLYRTESPPCTSNSSCICRQSAISRQNTLADLGRQLLEAVLATAHNLAAQQPIV